MKEAEKTTQVNYEEDSLSDYETSHVGASEIEENPNVYKKCLKKKTN